MVSATLFYNIRHTMGRRLWFSALLCAVVFLFTMPIFTAFSLQSAPEAWSKTAEQPQIRAVIAGEINHIFQANNGCTGVTLIIGAFLAGLLFFSYLHSRSRVDLFHSLPLTRGQLFTINYTAGALSVLLPYLLNLILTVLVVVCMGLGAALHWPTILIGLGMNILFFLAIYSVVVLAAMMTGHFVIQFMTSLFLLGLVPMALFFSYSLGKIFYPTWYTGQINWTEISLSTSPLTRWVLGVADQNFRFTGGTALLLAVLILLTILLALLLYTRRPSESAGQALVFPVLRPIIKYPAMVLTMAGVGLAFYQIGQNSLGWFMVGAVLTGIICGQVLEVLYRFDFSAIRRKLLPGLTVTALFCGICGLGFLDVTGYNTYIPNEEDITKVEIQLTGLNDFSSGSLIVPSESYSHLYRTDSIFYSSQNLYYGLNTGDGASLDGQKRTQQDREILASIQADPLRRYPVTTEDGMAAALDLVRQSIQTMEGNGNTYYVEYTSEGADGEAITSQDVDYSLISTYVLIRYTLDNGRTVTRQYACAPLYVRDIQEQIYTIYEDETYRRSQYVLFDLPVEQLWVHTIGAFECYDYSVGYEALPHQKETPSQPTVERLLSALEQELTALDGQDLREQAPIGCITIRAYGVAATPEVVGSDRPYISYNYPIYDGMTQTIAAMESFGVQAEYFLPRYEEAVEAAVIQYNTNVRYFSSKEETRENSSTPGSADAPAGSAVTLPTTEDQIIRTTDPEEIRQWIDQSIPEQYSLGRQWLDRDPMRSIQITYRDHYGQTYTQFRSLPHPL